MAKGTSNILEKFSPILLVLTIVLAFAVGVLWQKVANLEGGGTRVADLGQGPAAPADGKLSEEQAANVAAVSDEDFVRGNRNAEIFLIEYSDLECPFCASFHPTAKQALDEYGDQLAWVYRHFPLETIHPRAIPAAEASECVASLGGKDAFWDFTDYLFENQSSTTLSDSGLTTAATTAGVDSGAFSSCYEAQTFSANVTADYQSGIDAGVTGTPGNFVMNSKGEVWVVPGAVPFENLKSVIDEALAS